MVPVVYQILDLVPSFPKVHGRSLWFALCNTFSPLANKFKGFRMSKLGTTLQTTGTIHVTFGKVGD
ncbi:hypothetical protein Hanom_Chr12g01076491 [Helianthus anomalus]